MLDAITKRRIDSARDILVGKVPDPKSQVEQITIALIYKFMDDMDAQAEELGGERTFFAGEFDRYGWAQLMRGGLGGHEMLNRYAEAIERMPQNPGIPELFRQIFRNAYLPYRDPETLRAFLKEIDGFEYDHSERLGDAFEYLLQVLGSQGDAGQFRTPRHIIDFIVEVVNPQKDDVILDPACGTAGFLISAYKHIRRQNSTNPEAQVPDGQLLNHSDRERLAENIRGYDISPDMVRLSLVNLYLHHFPDPKIVEYDTLTSEEKWDEYADVILANPPFMSPKGGIRPHKRFSVQSKRSEVLFVDYIHEHLTPSGRAGIIVPEGVIFQSQMAYKKLRKLLVDEALIAVISLPAGVFNPYSGVKTSILILDKSLAKRSSTVGFFKVNNDGFGLGAQRREGGPNDLPQVLAEISKYRTALAAGEPVDELVLTHGLIVEKELLAKNGEYNLSGERYRAVASNVSEYPRAPLRDIVKINPEQSVPNELFDKEFTYIDITSVENGTGKFLGSTSIPVAEAPSRARRVVRPDDVLISTVRPNLRAFTIVKTPPINAIASTGFALLRTDRNILVPDLLLYLLRSDHAVKQMEGMMGRGAYPSINQADVSSLEIPLPPIDVQREIVAEIDGYQKVINGARAVVENYRPQIAVDPSWPEMQIGDVCNLVNGRSFKPEDWKPQESGGLPIVRIQNLNNSKSSFNYYTGDVKPQHLIAENALLFSWSGSRGSSFGAHIWRGSKAVLNQHIFKVEPKNGLVDKYYLFHALNRAVTQVEENLHGGVGLVHITKGNLEKIPVPLPPLEIQQAIVVEIEEEQRIINGNRQLIERMQAKIDAVISRIWGGPVDTAQAAD